MATLIHYQCDLCKNVYEDNSEVNEVELKINEFSCVSEKLYKMVCQICMVNHLAPVLNPIFDLFKDKNADS